MRIVGIIILCLLSIPAYARGGHSGGGHSSFQHGMKSGGRNHYAGTSPFSRMRKYQRYNKRQHEIERQWIKNYNKGHIQ